MGYYDEKEPLFETGDTVKLKTGGPEMTVNGYIHASQVKCAWFAGKKLQTGVFEEGALERVLPEEEQE